MHPLTASAEPSVRVHVVPCLVVFALACGSRKGVRVTDGGATHDVALRDLAPEAAATQDRVATSGGHAQETAVSPDAPVEAGADIPLGQDGPLDLESRCIPVTCDSQMWPYCGKIGDGCGGVLDCGECPHPGMTCGRCRPNVCSSDEGNPTTCQQEAHNYCGDIDSGLGCPLHCGACPAGQSCGGAGIQGICALTDCPSRFTCVLGSTQYCGWIGDGCGGSIDCGQACRADQFCGSDHICHLALCQPETQCGSTGSEYCGVIGDGCGGALTCDHACPAGQVCDSDHVCSGAPRPLIPAPPPPAAAPPAPPAPPPLLVPAPPPLPSFSPIPDRG